MQDKNGPTWAFHLAHYGANYKYQDFANSFKAELFDPRQWAELFARSGARYVVLRQSTTRAFAFGRRRRAGTGTAWTLAPTAT